MNLEIENLINMALADGEVTEKERTIILRKAESLGIDKDEVEMILDGKIALLKKEGSMLQSTILPKSNKEGDLKKCPSCGAPVLAFAIKCTDCGHEFRNVESSTSVKEFFIMLNDLESNTKEDENNPLKAIGNTYAKMFSVGGVFGGGKEGRQKRELIKNFPVPNTKEDILEFLALGVPRAKMKGNFFSSNFSDAGWEIKAHNLLVPIWQSKCEQIIMKARFSMKDDKKILEEIEYYAKQLKIK
jgi:hypothetical protein